MSCQSISQRLSTDPESIRKAASLLAEGQLVALPTETVYGLAAAARNPAAVAGIYAAKGRPDHNPLIVHIASLEMAQELALFDAEAESLAQAFWPGPLTLVLPLKDNSGLAPAVTAGLGTVALRIPAHETALALLKAFAGPVAAPSANPSGRISPTSADHVLKGDHGLDGRIAAVIDAGTCPVGLESTILGWQDGTPVILRPGGVSASQIEAVIGRAVGAPKAADEAKPLAPGMLASHYAPSVTVRLNATTPKAGETYIGFGRHAPEDALNLSPDGDLAEAASRLFDLLRRADLLGLPIAVAPIPAEGIGTAINDRLSRAAAPR